MATDRRRRRKAANGAGSVVRRPNGTYMARAMIRDPVTGASERKTWYGRTDAEARSKMVAAQVDSRRGKSAEEARPRTLEVWGRLWLDQLEVRYHTRRGYTQRLTDHVFPALGAVPLRQLSVSQVNALLRGLRDRGMAPSTVNAVRRVLRALLNDAIREGLADRNVAAFARPLAEKSVRPGRALEPDQVAEFLRVAAGHREGMVWVLALGGGLRISEVLGVRHRNVDAEAGRLLITQQLVREKGRYVLADVKTEKSRRKVMLPSWAAASLRGYIAEHPGEPDQLVFRRGDGEPMNGPGVTNRLHKALAAAGMTDFNMHDMRRSTSSLAAAEGVDPRLTAVAMGHSRPATTLDDYTVGTDALLRTVASALERAVPDKDL